MNLISTLNSIVRYFNLYNYMYIILQADYICLDATEVVYNYQLQL